MATTASLDALCSDVLRLMSSCFDPRDLLTFNLACKAAHDASQRRLIATALARTGARVALRRLRVTSASRACLAQSMTCKSTLSDRDQCFAQLKWCLSRSDDPLSDLTTALHKTQNALTQQTQAAPSAVRPILEDVGLWIVFVCLTAWRMHMHKAAGTQSHAEVAQHDVWGILDSDSSADGGGPAAGAGEMPAPPATDAQAPVAQAAELPQPPPQPQPGAPPPPLQPPQQQQHGHEQQQQQYDLEEEDMQQHIAQGPAVLTPAGLFRDLLSGLHRMVYSPNPSKKPGLATLNILVHFLAQITAEA